MMNRYLNRLIRDAMSKANRRNMMRNFNQNRPPDTPQTEAGLAMRLPHTIYNNFQQTDYENFRNKKLMEYKLSNE